MNQKPNGTDNLIKRHARKTAAAAGAPAPKIVKNQILAARAEAARIIAEAEAFAAEIRREAQEETASLRRQAYAEGMEKSLAEFERNLLEALEIRERVWRETERDLLRLAIRLAEKIVGREISTDKKTISDIVAAALQNARQQEKLTVRVNPSDLSLIEEEREKFLPSGRARFIDLVADPRVSSGGCLIESEVGTIDARLETQLRVLERALLAQSDGEGAFD
ncbi:MAG TPA: type III secretion system stator protein SctL [Pyrinomonadaceae bacterium]|nr:type III secretion system stator protein SctL [Pyrinomonadaceae bacterium]